MNKGRYSWFGPEEVKVPFNQPPVSKLYIPSLIFSAITILFCAITLCCVGRNVHAAEKAPRMEVLGYTDIGGTASLMPVYLHDNETGQEVVCITALTHMDGAMSCYPTGRKW